jgi:ribosome biogenesis GTPase
VAGREVDAAVARVVAEHRGAWDVVTPAGEAITVRLPGLARHEAEDRRDLPVVGDLVLVAPPAEGGIRYVREVLPRTSLLLRRAAGRAAVPQPIAANIDLILIVTSVGPELRPARLERYLAGAASSGAEARIILNKIDREGAKAGLQAPAIDAALAPFADRVQIARTSAETGDGVDEVASWCAERISVMVGSSGVGKSTLVNRLLGASHLPTAPTRRRDDEGRHTTRRRELLWLPGGGALVDTPGMREFGVWADGAGEDDGPRRGR